MTLLSISVVICCHNSASRLPETLRHLAQQEIPLGLAWEILVIDNASTDETADVVKQFAVSHPYPDVRVVNEPQLGQGYARQRGMAEARYESILFVDDDNWLAPNYVALVAETLRQNPHIGALGGMSTAQCEGPEPIWLSRYQGWYAVTGPGGSEPELHEEPFLWTAGAAFRRQTLDRVKSLGLPFLMSGRRGKTLDGGEDVELSYLVRLAGCRMYRHTDLHFRHYLPADRLTWKYLRRLLYAAGLVSVRLDVYRLGGRSLIWHDRLLRSCWAQMGNACFQMMRHRLLSWLLWLDGVERNDRFLRSETYRGRFVALWSHRREYRGMIGGRGRETLQARISQEAANSSTVLSHSGSERFD